MTTTLIRTLQHDLKAGGLTGSFLVRDLETGDELGFGEHTEYPIASLVKIPLAIATLEKIHNGQLDPATPVIITPTPPDEHPPPGLGWFQHSATISIADLIYLSVGISDNTAADTLFTFTSREEVTNLLRQIGNRDITIRHTLHELPAVEADGDLTKMNTATALGLTELLQTIWTPGPLRPSTAHQVRALMASNVHRHRLALDLTNDATRWSSKTASTRTHRHEIGVAEHPDGQHIALVALTESALPNRHQPAAEALISHTARRLHDHLRHQ